MLSLLLPSCFIFFLLTLIYYIDGKYNPDVFSPAKVAVIFLALANLPLISYSLNHGFIEEYIFSQLAIQFHSFNDLFVVSWLNFFSILVVFGGIYTAQNLKRFNAALFSVYLSIFRFRFSTAATLSTRCFLISIVFYLVGLIVFLTFLSLMGGLSHVWGNLLQRAEMSAGLMYIQKLYTFMLTLFSIYIFVWSYKNKRYRIFSYALIFITVVILGLLAQRGPVAVFIFSLIVVYHYCCRPLVSIFNLYTVSLAFLLLIFMSSAVQIRLNGIDAYSNLADLMEDMAEHFQRDVVLRFGRIERDLVVYSYFKEQDFWNGESYISVFTSPMPRFLYEEKPILDTGKYLVALSYGELVAPPLTPSKAYSYSWPDGNWAAYMNFGLIGLYVSSFFSGFIFGGVYSAFKKQKANIFIAFLYGTICFFAPWPLSPLGIVDYAIVFVFIGVISLFFSIFASLRFSR